MNEDKVNDLADRIINYAEELDATNNEIFAALGQAHAAFIAMLISQAEEMSVH